MPQTEESTLDQMSTEEKIILAGEEGLGSLYLPELEWRELDHVERLSLVIDVLELIPEEQRTEEVQEAISEAVSETERALNQPRVDLEEYDDEDVPPYLGAA